MFFGLGGCLAFFGLGGCLVFIGLGGCLAFLGLGGGWRILGFGGGVGNTISFVERTVKMSWSTVSLTVTFTRFLFLGPDVSRFLYSKDFCWIHSSMSDIKFSLTNLFQQLAFPFTSN